MSDFWQRMLWSAERLSHSVEWLAVGLIVLLGLKWFVRDLILFSLKQKAVPQKRRKRIWTEGYICEVAPTLSFYVPRSSLKTISGPSVMVDTPAQAVEIDKETIEKTIDFLSEVLESKIKAPSDRRPSIRSH